MTKAAPKKPSARTAPERAIKLNAIMRDSLVASILSDLPYPDFSEGIAAAEQAAIEAAPQGIRTALKNPDTRDYIKTASRCVILHYETGRRRERYAYQNLLILNMPTNGTRSGDNVHLYSSCYTL